MDRFTRKSSYEKSSNFHLMLPLNLRKYRKNNTLSSLQLIYMNFPQTHEYSITWHMHSNSLWFVVILAQHNFTLFNFNNSDFFIQCEMKTIRFSSHNMWRHAMGEHIPLLGRCPESGPSHVADEGFPLQCMMLGNRGSSSKRHCPPVRPFLSDAKERVVKKPLKTCEFISVQEC